MSVLLCGGLVAILLAAALGCFRVSEWHSEESEYWYRVAALVRLNPALDVTYRPILDWARANRPSVLERLHGWQSPPDRMESAAVEADRAAVGEGGSDA